MTHLDVIRQAIVAIKPEGVDGFEGLVGRLLMAWTGCEVRLARSGYQGGRDGGTGGASIAILFEAKRYGVAKVNLRELQGELAAALQDYPQLELYIVAATQPLSDEIDRRLSDQAAEKGAEILLLDWSGNGVTPLAAFMARFQEHTLDWFARHAPLPNPSVVATALSAVASERSFGVAVQRLCNQLSAANLSIETLRKASRTALRDLFSDGHRARKAFGQFLAPLDETLGPIDRPRFSQHIEAWWRVAEARQSVLTVVGDEGVGKSWIIPQWWLNISDSEAPILIWIPAHFTRDYGPLRDPLRFLAEAIVSLVEFGTRDAASRWEKRLHRWLTADNLSGRRFLIVLDGLNEATGVAWASLIESLTGVLVTLGGKLAITCRQGFWMAEVRDRLSSVLPFTNVSITNFDDDELVQAVAQRSIDLTQINSRVCDFIRNPRVFAIASQLLSRMSPGELTVERLLFEYWGKRLEERGDHIAHTGRDMQRVLQSHARELRDDINRRFDVDKWRQHSTRSERALSVSFNDDLTEVVEGRFFERDPGDESKYRVRREVLPFALGLLVVDEVRGADANEVAQRLDQVLDPIAGFDRTADIVAAAAGIALLDRRVNQVTAVAFLERWLSLQNVPDEAFQHFKAYAIEQPEAYLDLIEALYASFHHPRRAWAVTAMRAASDRVSVRDLLMERAQIWMGFWSLDEPRYLRPGASETERAAILDQEQRRRDRIQCVCRAFTVEEQTLFNRLCRRVDSPHLPLVAGVVPALLACHPLEGTSYGALAWMLALEVAGRSISDTGFSWIYDFNSLDYAPTAEALTQAAEEMLRVASQPETRNAAARLLSLTGTVDGERRCKALFEYPAALRDHRPWRLVESFCDTDPLDPHSGFPSNIGKAAERLGKINECSIRSKFGLGPEDHDLDMVTAGLARFDHPRLIDFWRRVLDTFSTRSYLAIRQLTLVLPSLSPLLREEHVAALSAFIRTLADPSHPLRQQEHMFVPTRIAAAILPHLDGNRQLALIADLPPDMLWTDDFPKLLKPADTNAFEGRLRAAAETQDASAFIPVLQFAATGKQSLTEAARRLMIGLLTSPNEFVRALVFRTAVASGDPLLLQGVVNSGWTPNEAGTYEAFYGSKAMAMAARSLDIRVPFDRLATELHGYAAAISGRLDDLRSWGRLLVGTLTQLMMPSRVEPLEGIVRYRSRSPELSPEFAHFAPVSFQVATIRNDPFEEAARKSEDENQTRRARIDALLATLRSSNLNALVDFPSIAGFEQLGACEPLILRNIGERIAELKELRARSHA